MSSTPRPPVLRAVPLGIFSAILVGVAVAAEAPRVLETVPANGDLAVAVDLAELRVTFDRDMRTDRFSFVGGGPTFPEVAGRPHWTDKRTCVLPVRLAPGRSYVVGINGGSHWNFQATDGTPAKALALRFAVVGGEELSADANSRAIDTLLELFRTRYSHADLHGVDWEAHFGALREELEGSTSAAQFAARLAAALAPARDRHLWVKHGEQLLPTHAAPLEDPTFDFERVQKLVPDFEIRSRCVFTGTFPKKGGRGPVGYLLIGTWERSRTDDLEAIYPALEAMRELPALIVDVRANAGGDERLAQRLASHFVDERTVYAKHRWRDPAQEGGWSELVERAVDPAPEDQRYTGRVAVLVGGRVMSSCESFAKMMDEAPRVTLVGQRTTGSSGNPQEHDLGNGVVVAIPGWQDHTAEGDMIEGRGLEPDVEVETPRRSGRRDVVIERALEVLRGDK